MPKTIEKRPKTLPQYLELVEAAQKRAGHSLWFRGCGTARQPLLPTIYRHPKKPGAAELVDLERQLMTRFRQRSIPYHARDLRDDWEALFFMQHYGVPTRLLDWTENPLIALHFALMSAPSRRSRGGTRVYKQPAAVWILDPVQWNKGALEHLSYSGLPLTPGDEALKGYLPSSVGPSGGKYPVAMYGAHNSARIVAQQGVFTIFGNDRSPMERLQFRQGSSRPALIQVTIPPNRILDMRLSLLNQGITESVVFPDLDGLARETKRHFGFEI